RLAGIAIAAQHRIDALAKKRLGKFPVGLDPSLHQVLEAFCPCHRPVFRLARACSACSPASKHAPHRYRAAAASWSRPSARYDRLAIPPEINSIAGTKIDPKFQHSFSHAFDVGEIALLDAGERTNDLGAGRNVVFREPFSEWTLTARGEVGNSGFRA